MSPLLAPVLVLLQDEAVRLGSSLIEDGIKLVRNRLTGEASDADVMIWLAAAQEPS
jgi:hypothetical protein